MDTTSHFLWIKLKSEYFVPLYTQIQKLLGDKKDIVEFQNILSIHITLYYFPKQLSSNDIKQIQTIKKHFWKRTITLQWYATFGDSIHSKMYYLEPGNSDGYLDDCNNLLRNTFQEYSSIIDNTYSFIPHITLFKIRDIPAFENVRIEVEEILKNYLLSTVDINIYESIELFQVNSDFSPEIQIILPLSD